MRILLVEDDMVLAQSLCEALEEEGMHIDQADRGKDGLELAGLYEYQAMVLDLGLPDMRGDEVLLNLRQQNPHLSVLILSGETEIESRLGCLRDGADDYLVKPFNTKELIARLHALVRRANGHSSNVLSFGQVQFDMTARNFRVGEARVALTAKEYAMMELLCLRKGSVVSKESFLDHLYGGMDEPEMKIIDVFICKLRKKFEDAGVDFDPIETVWGRGYRIKTDSDRIACSA